MWNGFIVHHRFRETVYHIKVMQKQAGEKEAIIKVDGIMQPGKVITLLDDDKEHSVEVVM